jgi:hypothetical protein
MKLGSHLLKACERLVIEAETQKRFILKFLFMFERLCQQKDIASHDQVIIKLIESLSSMISVAFLRECSQEETKVLFYAIWNLAFEAKERQLVTECKQMLGALYS